MVLDVDNSDDDDNDDNVDNHLPSNLLAVPHISRGRTMSEMSLDLSTVDKNGGKWAVAQNWWQRLKK